MAWLAGTIVDGDIGEWLVSQLGELERSESVWLKRLAEFDVRGDWVEDGYANCASWMTWRLKMARSTAFEKLQVAHQVRRRPIIGGAFAEGRISYSALRSLARIDNPDPDVDTALVIVAESGTVADVEKAVRFYQLHADQHRPPVDPRSAQSLRYRSNPDGTGTVTVTLPDLDAKELLATLQAFVDRADPKRARFVNRWSVDESADADSPPAQGSSQGPVDESADADWDGYQLDPPDGPSLGARRAQAVMDMARVALNHMDGPPAAGADRYMLHLVVQDGHTQTLDGTPIDDQTAGRITCDASTVTHLVGGSGEPLALGRRTREWTAAQRRAITVRDAGTCRWPGCTHHLYVDIHHHRWWSKGGPTDVDNGYLACGHHHQLIHEEGYIVEGDPNGELSFYRPNGMIIGTTSPRRR